MKICSLTLRKISTILAEKQLTKICF